MQQTATTSTRTDAHEPGTSREQWRNTILAGLANYIDAGSIVAGAAGLTLWTEKFGLSSSFVGIIGAFSSNAISAGVGALIGGWLCDQYGRKRIYQWDLLAYAFGLLWIIFASEPWMLVTGYVLAGLAVGADVPASWTLIAETAPDKERGRHAGVAQVLWMMGPVIVLAMAFALSGLGILGIKIVFAHLFVVALVLWALRRRMSESRMWADARSGEAARGARFHRDGAADEPHDTAAPPKTGLTLSAFRELVVERRYLGPLAFLTGMYGLWNLMAGTNGFYLPFILRTVGSQSQAMSVALHCSARASCSSRSASPSSSCGTSIASTRSASSWRAPSCRSSRCCCSPCSRSACRSRSAMSCSSASAAVSPSSRSSSSGAGRCSRR
jgi:inositol transporter-like SP family MFS transporter